MKQIKLIVEYSYKDIHKATIVSFNDFNDISQESIYNHLCSEHGVKPFDIHSIKQII